MSQHEYDHGLDEHRIGRKRQEGDDDISPWKYYGSIFVVILLIFGMVSLFFV